MNYSALGYFQESLDNLSKVENKKSIEQLLGIIYASKGHVYYLQGKIHEASALYNNALDKVFNNGSYPPHEHFLRVFTGLGTIALTKLDDITALIWLKKAIYFGKQVKINFFGLNETLSKIIDVSIKNNYLDYGKLILGYMEENKKRKNSFIESNDQKFTFLLTKAKILMISSRLKDKVEADQLLNEIIENDKFNNRKLEAMLLAVKMRLFEFQTTGDSESLEEFNKLVSKIVFISNSAKLPKMSIEILMLLSKYQVVGGNLDKATEYLSEAKNLAEKNNFPMLIEEISIVFKEINEQFEKWNNFVEKNVYYKKQAIKVQFEDYINEALLELKNHNYNIVN